MVTDNSGNNSGHGSCPALLSRCPCLCCTKVYFGNIDRDRANPVTTHEGCIRYCSYRLLNPYELAVVVFLVQV